MIVLPLLFVGGAALGGAGLGGAHYLHTIQEVLKPAVYPSIERTMFSHFNDSEARAGYKIVCADGKTAQGETLTIKSPMAVASWGMLYPLVDMVSSEGELSWRNANGNSFHLMKPYSSTMVIENCHKDWAVNVSVLTSLDKGGHSMTTRSVEVFGCKLWSDGRLAQGQDEVAKFEEASNLWQAAHRGFALQYAAHLTAERAAVAMPAGVK